MISLANKPLAVAAVFAAICLALVFFVINPLITNIKETGIGIAWQGVEIDGYDQRLRKAKEFGSFVKDQRDNFKKLDALFVDSQMPLDFINALEVAARDTGVEVEFSSSLPQQKKNEWPSITMEAEIYGSISGILQFIEKTEMIPYLVAVESVGIEAGELDVSSGIDNKKKKIDASDPGQAHILLKAYAKLQKK